MIWEEVIVAHGFLQREIANALLIFQILLSVCINRNFVVSNKMKIYSALVEIKRVR